MGSRMMKNIKVKKTPNGKEVIDFSHSSERFTCSHSSASVEVIRFYNNSVYFYSSSSNASKKVHIYSATEQDFEVLKNMDKLLEDEFFIVWITWRVMKITGIH